ncbi:hypothetical protein DX928_23435 [Bacillus swezeyi]|uniref:Uncharacterized protein n=2 Tax=Bacillus swezeyi TaxID=1925020 RepID=A0A5M8REC8_9BACI|nr:hypothetical protein DX927_23195 [Bacillus swezeyi]KAA6471525.1 hypothetical protein DX928_23435 [Bacillus swezeyi]
MVVSNDDNGSEFYLRTPNGTICKSEEALKMIEGLRRFYSNGTQLDTEINELNIKNEIGQLNVVLQQESIQ